MKKSESNIKAIDDFVDGADSNIRTKKVVDKKKPVSFSATDKQLAEIQGLVKKYNALAYKNDNRQEINRSDLIMAMKSHFEKMSDIEFYKEINKLGSVDLSRVIFRQHAKTL
ncbi:hypothetical protein SIL85_22555 [Shewanella oneidensis]|nr:hypothetical protein [Shewanella oneidensis]MDX5999746.1 hypothetical protein [Shewanella oneidensis]